MQNFTLSTFLRWPFFLVLTAAGPIACDSAETSDTNAVATNLGSNETFFYKTENDQVTRTTCAQNQSTPSSCVSNAQSVTLPLMRLAFEQLTPSATPQERLSVLALIESGVTFRPLSENSILSTQRPLIEKLAAAFVLAKNAAPRMYLNFLSANGVYESPSDFQCRYSFSRSGSNVIVRVGPRNTGNSCSSSTELYECKGFENACISPDGSETMQICANGDLTMTYGSSKRRYYLGGYQSGLTYQPCIVKTPLKREDIDQVDAWLIKEASYREYQSGNGRDVRISWTTDINGLMREEISLNHVTLSVVEYRLSTNSAYSPRRLKLEAIKVISGAGVAPAEGSVQDCTYLVESSAFFNRIRMSCPGKTWGGISGLPSSLQM